MRKQVILYSGGMDSFILGHMEPGAFKLYVDTGSKYAKKEIANLPNSVHVHPDKLDLRAIERDDAIVPARNAYLALMAANYGDEIMLGATAGDLSTDKDVYWASLMTNVLGYMYSGKHFPEERNIHVSLPIKGMTKGKLVQWYLSMFYDPVALANVVSCYHPTHTHCGTCKACMRKWAALEANGVPFDGWHTHPSKADWSEPVQRWADGKWWRTLEEDNYTRSVLRRHGVPGA